MVRFSFKMLKLLNYFFCFVLYSCVHGEGSKHKSAWSDLSSASSADCEAWKKSPVQLGVDSVKFAQGLDWVWSEGRQRRGTRFLEIRTVENMSKEDEAVAKVEVGQEDVILGVTRFKNLNVAVVAVAQKGRSLVEVRDLRNQKVIFRSQPLNFQAQDGWLIKLRSDTGAALVFKEHENLFHVISLRPDEKAPMRLQFYGNGSLQGRPEFLAEDTSAGVLRFVFGRSREQLKDPLSPEWVVRSLNLRAAAPPADVVWKVKLTAELESWTAREAGDTMSLVLVVGDSLVGQSELQLRQFPVKVSKGNHAESGNAVHKLVDVHVTEPLWFGPASGGFLGLIQWIDEESTLGVYRIQGAQLTKGGLFGVFPKGTMVYDRVREARKNSYSFVTRHRDGYGWLFQVCSVKA